MRSLGKVIDELSTIRYNFNIPCVNLDWQFHPEVPWVVYCDVIGQNMGHFSSLKGLSENDQEQFAI
jgi:hypothetical protein